MEYVLISLICGLVLCGLIIIASNDLVHIFYIASKENRRVTFKELFLMPKDEHEDET